MFSHERNGEVIGDCNEISLVYISEKLPPCVSLAKNNGLLKV